MATPVMAQTGSGDTLPASGNCNSVGGSIFYLTAGDVGLYVCESGAWVKKLDPGGGAAWGGITGTLSNQSDLQTALNGKQASGSAESVVSLSSLLHPDAPASLIARTR